MGFRLSNEEAEAIKQEAAAAGHKGYSTYLAEIVRNRRNAPTPPVPPTPVPAPATRPSAELDELRKKLTALESWRDAVKKAVQFVAVKLPPFPY